MLSSAALLPHYKTVHLAKLLQKCLNTVYYYCVMLKIKYCCSMDQRQSLGMVDTLVYNIIIALKDFCLYTIATTPNDWERLYDPLSNNLIFSITQYTKEQHR